jgi:hypothetical protein
MESEGLKEFLSTVGDAVHSVNTICVGLTSVRSGKAVKPDDLTIGWSTSDPKNSASKARSFALKGSLVFVEEALLKYLDFLKLCTNENEPLRRALTTEGAADRVAAVTKHLSIERPYWGPMVVLLVRWRNKVVHNSSGKLTSNQKKVLLDNRVALKKNHADIDIEKTLEHFGENKITLKDFTTLIAITIRYVRALDSSLEPIIDTMYGFGERLKMKGLVSDYNKIFSHTSKSRREAKLNGFLRTHFPDTLDSFKRVILEHGRYSSDLTEKWSEYQNPQWPTQ